MSLTRTKRYEFSKQIKRDALARSGGECEGMGKVYGLGEGQRCNGPLSYGVEFDHYPLPATDEGSDTLDNCVAVCRTCHNFKTTKYDIPMQAKGKRIRDKVNGIRTKRKWQSPGFPAPTPQRTATGPIVRKSERTE